VKEHRETIVFVVALFVSCIGHWVLIDRGASYARAQPRPTYIPVEMALVEPPPPPEPVEETPPPPKPEKVKAAELKPPKKAEPPPANKEPPPEPPAPDTPPPIPVFGVTMESVVGADTGAAMSVRVGNTLAKDPEKEFTPPDEVQPFKVTSRFDVDRMPQKKRRCTIDYPQEARNLGIEGKVILEVEVLGDGSVGKVKIIKGPGYGLNKAALRAVKKCSFSPAVQGGRPVTTTIRFTYRWELDDY
jgi:protein TonB